MKLLIFFRHRHGASGFTNPQFPFMYCHSFARAQYVLGHIRRIRRDHHHPEGHVVDPGLVPPDEGFKGLLVSAHGSGHQALVGLLLFGFAKKRVAFHALAVFVIGDRLSISDDMVEREMNKRPRA
jgi:hypothetical protein